MTEGTKPTAISHFDSAAARYEASTGGCTRELARHILDLPQLASLYEPNAVVLDNACGTGIVAEEIAQRCLRTQMTFPKIHAVDPASNMVDIARKKLEALEASGKFSAEIMPGEKLDFPDETFTHNVANLGILFFEDGIAGAKEIYRTLKPGGIALVTSWSALGYLENVIHPAQKSTAPDGELYKLPISGAWFDSEHLRTCLQDGGFKEVSIEKCKVHYGAATVDQLRDLLLGSFQMLWKDLPKVDQANFSEAVGLNIKKVAVPFTMIDGEPGVGVPMEAIIAVCTK